MVAGLKSLLPMMVVFCVSRVLGTADALRSSWGAPYVFSFGCLSPIENSCSRFRATRVEPSCFPHTRKAFDIRSAASHRTVHLTSVDKPVPGNQEFCFAHLQTMYCRAGQKIRSPTWGIVWWSLLAEIWFIVVYILQKSHSSACHLLSYLNFELLKSVTYANLCACAPWVDKSKNQSVANICYVKWHQW